MSVHPQSLEKRKAIAEDYLSFRPPPYQRSAIDYIIELNSGISYLKHKVEQIRNTDNWPEVLSRQHNTRVDLIGFESRIGEIKLGDLTGDKILTKTFLEYISFKKTFEEEVKKKVKELVEKEAEFRREIAKETGKITIGLDPLYPDN